MSLTDPRVKYERAPFDRPEIFVPEDGRAPDNTRGRNILLADERFLHVPAVGATGRFLEDGITPDPLPNFLGVSSVLGDPGPDHFDSITVAAPIEKLTVLSPNGGEVLLASEPFAITWNGPEGVDHYRVQLSPDNGTTWSTIPGAENLPGTARSFSWTVNVPLKNRAGNLVRVRAFNANNVVIAGDRSDRPFTIEVVRVISPNFGGEILVSGDEFDIEWHIHATRRDINRMRIEFTRNGGQTWEKIAVLDAADDFAPAVVVGDEWTYNWTVPTVLVPRKQCKVRVTLRAPNGNIIGRDASDRVFTLQPTP